MNNPCLKRLLLVVCLSVLAPATVWATSPPKETNPREPLVTAESPERRAVAVQAPEPKPLDAKTIESLDIDPNLKRMLLEGVGAQKSVTPEPPEEPAPDAGEAPAGPRARRDARIAANTVVVSTAQATADVNEDYEPAVIVNRFSGIDRVTTAFMKYDTGTINPNLHFRTTTDFVNFTGGQLPLPAGHSRSADPMLAQNYSTLGAFPKRTYCSGISLQINASGQYTNGALNVWHTDNPGTTPWTLTTVDTATSPQLLDKPSIWTSWHSGTRGYTYLVAVLVNGSTNTFRVYRKTTTNTWTLVNSQFSGTGGMQSPIVTVDVNTGHVYLVWVNWSARTISIARSTNQGVNFGAPVTFDAGPVVNGSGNVCDVNNANCLRGTTTLMARPNATDGSIGVIWHRRDFVGSLNTDVYFNAFDYATQTWRGARLVNDNSTGDQFNPALDPDANGNYMVTWYDRRHDPNDRKYHLYGAKLDPSGNPLEASNVLLFSGVRPSDPNQFPADGAGRRYMGEYQDVWEWLGTWYSITMYAPDPASGGSGQPNLYLTRIQP
ncbi:MAG TPA: hypothetical protein VEO54_04225 [Thermoanaerobaculia bacterium]|nr:hypothetical protein [Thermoanaerobaculia bacterium]